MKQRSLNLLLIFALFLAACAGATPQPSAPQATTAPAATTAPQSSGGAAAGQTIKVGDEVYLGRACVRFEQ